MTRMVCMINWNVDIFVLFIYLLIYLTIYLFINLFLFIIITIIFLCGRGLSLLIPLPPPSLPPAILSCVRRICRALNEQKMEA